MFDEKILNEWLTHPKVSSEMKKVIKAMDSETKSIAFNPHALSFGTAGIRGIMGPGPGLLNEFVYQQIAYGYGKFLVQKRPKETIKILIAHDNRLNGVRFSEVVAQTLTSFGIKVIFFKANTLAPTPLVSYTVRKLKLHGAVNITASHNPKEYNGFKVYDHRGVQLLPDDCALINQFMPQSSQILDLVIQPINTNIGFLDDEIIKAYFNDITNVLKNTNPQENKHEKIIFTGLHGTTSQLLPNLLLQLGYVNVIPVIEQCNIDGNFSAAKVVNPEYPAAFDLAITYAHKYGSNTIVALDPDGDRFALAIRLPNDKWYFFNGNEMGIIYTYYSLMVNKYQHPYVVSTYVSTYLVDRMVQDYGGEVYRTKTGFKWIGDKVDQIIQSGNHDLIVGFEEAVGALISPINRDKDGLQSAALALEIINWAAKQSINLHDLLYKVIMSKYGSICNRSVTIEIADAGWKQIAKKWMDAVKVFPSSTIEGLTIKKMGWNAEGDCVDWILENDAWIRFRISGTEPKFKVYYNLYGTQFESLLDQVQICTKKIKNYLGVK